MNTLFLPVSHTSKMKSDHLYFSESVDRVQYKLRTNHLGFTLINFSFPGNFCFLVEIQVEKLCPLMPS